MTLPTTGPISMAQVRPEIGVGGSISLDHPDVRSLAAVPAGEISMADLRGKTGTGSSTAFSVVPVDGESSGDPTGTVFTAESSPSVTISAGTAPYTILWTITTQDDSGFVLTFADQANCIVSHQIGKYGYVGGCSLSCTVSDSLGNVVTKTGIRAEFNYQTP